MCVSMEGGVWGNHHQSTTRGNMQLKKAELFSIHDHIHG